MAFSSFKDRLDCWSGKCDGDFRTVYFHRDLPEGNIEIAKQYQQYPDNSVVSSKYTVWNFLPKNLFEQFRRIANFYFLCISIVQLFIDSPVSPLTSILPLCFVVAVTALKQGYEDWKRHQADKEVNFRKYECVSYVNGSLISLLSKDIKVGDVVKVKADEEFPCDLILLSSDDLEGKCYVTTANLDGETNLKVHRSLTDTASRQTSEELHQFKSRIECQHPLADLYKFHGKMIFKCDGEEVTKSLSSHQLLLRGARLKNTNYVFGVAVYTGMDTKMALNQRQNPHKYSSVERKMNTYLIVFLILLILISTLHTVLNRWYQGTDSGSPPYVEKADTGSGQFVEDFLSFLILYNYVIPISLYVTIELQKFIGALFFNWDIEMYNPDSDEPAKANTSDLNEELGQIQYVFTDKTGTLTENDMQFRMCSINGTKYEEVDEFLCEDGLISKTFKHSDFTSEMSEFFLALALCHTVHATKEKDKNALSPYLYQASSPDEKAFVECAHKYGFTFQGMSGENMLVKIGDNLKRYQLLHVLEFDSIRKRMSVIVRDYEGTIIMFCKGAETAILEKTVDGPSEQTLSHINSFAETGLRTLAIARKVILESEYEEVDAKLKNASEAINERDEQLAIVYDEVESHLTLLGATGVEDRLQDKVKETIVALRDGGMKVWILTGDQQETAVNISHSCGHVQSGMEVLEIVKKDSVDAVEQSLITYNERLDENPDKNFALVIDGSSLRYALDGNKDLFVSVSQYCVAVLCCRMSPLQKAQVVKLIKHSKEKPITLAIGDGANDCSMIQEAHVGIGIMGKEGRQAVRTSDYAISRFKYLRRVLFVHGHLYYIRLAIVVQYFFYKNVFFTIPQYFYAFFNAYSQQTLYQSVYLTSFNICWTSLPILIYGIFEQHLRTSTLEFQPVLYRDISGNKCLSWLDFTFWMLSASWHGLVVFFGSYFFFGEGMINDKAFGNWSLGQFVYTVVVIICNLKLGLFSCYWTFLNHIVIWGSIIAYILFAVVASSSLWDAFQFDNKTYDLYWIMEQLLSEPSVWFGFLVITAAALLPDMAFTTLTRYYYRTRTQVAQESFKSGIGKILHNSKVWKSNVRNPMFNSGSIEVQDFKYSQTELVENEEYNQQTTNC